MVIAWHLCLVLFSTQAGIEANFTAWKNTLVSVPGDTPWFVSGVLAPCYTLG